MSTNKPLTDSFGDEMVFVDSYSGYLPQSDNIPVARTHNGKSGVTYDGQIYCIDCALDMGLIDKSDLEEARLTDKPWTGFCYPRHECQTQMHCGNHKQCINSLDGDEHPYNHSSTIGIGIDEQIIEH